MKAFPYHMRNGRDISERHPNADMATIARFFNLPRRQWFPSYADAPAYIERGQAADARALERARRLAREHGIGLEERDDRFFVALELKGKASDPLRGARVRKHGREVLEAVELVAAFLLTHPNP